MARKKAELPPMLVTKPITDRLEKIRGDVEEQRRWNGNDSPSVRTGELIIAEIEDAMREASEVWQSTQATHALTGWDEQTLVKHGRRKLAGEQMKFEWRSLQVRRDPSGYAFKVSTVPSKPAAKSA